LVGAGEVVAREQGLGVILAQDPHAAGEGLLEQGDGPAQVSRRLVSAGEVVAGGQGVWVVLAQKPHAVGEGLLQQGNGPTRVPRLPIGVGEVVAGEQGVGVVLAQDPLPTGEGTLEVPLRAGGLTLCEEERSCLIEEVGGGLGVCGR